MSRIKNLQSASPQSHGLCGPHRGSAVASAVAMALYGSLPSLAAAQQATGGPEEIVVTASRREQSVQDIPYNISAVGGADLDAAGITNLADITRVVPGLQSPDLGPRAAGVNSTFIIRGLNTNDLSASSVAPNLSVPLVSTYIDEVPLFTNLRLGDIQRIEVLRGPQGTLYGSGSVGGTVRVIHNPPSFKGTEFSVATGGSNTSGAGDTSYSFDTLFNAPLGEHLALRLSAGYDKEAGYIDANRAVRYDAQLQPVLADPMNPVTSTYATESLRDINGSESWHVRGALLWRPTDAVSAEFAYQHQNDESQGESRQTLGQPKYTINTQIPLEPLHRKVDMASLTVTADAGFATLTSSSSWYRNAYTDIRDVSRIELSYAGAPYYYGNYPRFTLVNYDDSKDRSFAQELRLVSNGDGPLSWIAGAFYRDQKQFITDPEVTPGYAAWTELPGSGNDIEDYLGLPRGTFRNFGDFAEFYTGRPRPSSLRPTDFVYNFTRTSTFRDYAGFGEISYQFTPAWQATVGGRVFNQKFTQAVVQELPNCGAPCTLDPTNPTAANGTSRFNVSKSFSDQIFKFNTSYKFSAETTAYLTIAQGFRHGGPNALCVANKPICYTATEAAALQLYDSDTALNYEIGVKGYANDRRLQYSLGLYMIDWKDIQLETFSIKSFTTLILNGKKARSQGLEAELTARLADGLDVTIGYSYNDAKLTENFVKESFVGRDGDRLPSVSKNTLSAAVDYLQRLGDRKSIHYRVDAAYRSNFSNQLNDCGLVRGVVACPYPGVGNSAAGSGYALLDGFTTVTASVSYSPDEHWEIRAFGRNLTDELGVTASGRTSIEPRYNSEFVTRPRTFGVEVRYQFK
jgi:outer membrane receptor protein involved in Fe transport